MGVFLFILGLMVGGTVGITVLCMCQINRDEERNM